MNQISSDSTLALHHALQQFPPTTKIETVSLGSMRRITSVLFFCDILAVVLGAIIVSLAVIIRDDWLYSIQWDVLAELVCRTVASFMLTFALLTFPQRILRARYAENVKLTPLEWSLIACLVIFSCIPGFSVYGVVVGWLAATAKIYSAVQFLNDGPFDTSLNTLFFLSSQEAFVASVVFTAIELCFLFALGFILIAFQSYPKSLKLETAESFRMGSQEVKKERTDGEDFSRMQEHIYLRSQYQIPLQRVKCCLSACWNFYCSVYVYLLLSAYFVSLLCFGLIFDFFISYIPFVSVVSVIRVCIMDVNLLVPQTIVRNNFTFYVVSNLSNEFSVCSPQQPDNNNAFWISVGCVIFFIFELLLLVELLKALPLAREHLASLPYARTRRYQLGFTYFSYTTRYSFCFVLLMALLTTCILPVSVFVVPEIRQVGNMTSLIVQPLYQVGVTSGGFGFGSCFLIISTWILLICYANLPADSKGFMGWFTSTSMLPVDAKPKSDVLLPLGTFLCWEREVLQLETDLLLLPSGFISRHAIVLRAQLDCRVVCLETVILLYHFMSLSYDLTELTSWEAQCAMVEDKRFQLVAYFKDDISDTHAFVFVSDCRIVVAFRGSVSFTNYLTDYDSAEVIFEDACNVKPDMEEYGNSLLVTNLAEKTKPKVHRGFVRTYDTVKDRLRALIVSLISPEKVVMITGHSLGGGLAIVCAMDLALSCHLSRDQISLTTFGCPMPGNLSFCTRLHRLVPCSHRLATMNDVITNLPIQTPVQEYTMNGWFHVGKQVLLLPNGNVIIDPSQIELFMMHTSSSISAHFRLSYAVALATWAIRSNEMHASWWDCVIVQFLTYGDLSPLPQSIRTLLELDLRRPGIPYLIGNVLYKDMAVDTSEVVEEEELVRNARRDFLLAIQRYTNQFYEREKKEAENAFLTLSNATSLPSPVNRDEETTPFLSSTNGLFSV